MKNRSIGNVIKKEKNIMKRSLLALGVMAMTITATAQTPTPEKLGGVEVPSSAVKSLSAGAFQKLHAALKPTGERWMEIPWQTDLLAARQKAAREKKPLLMWIMDGHPLGCT